jgi:rhamnose transport system ATP-binding protein
LSEQPEEVPRLALDQAAKAFGAVQALVDGSITLFPGEAHALVGENGAGKSTLVKILAGVYQPDSGTLAIDGQPVVLSGPTAARDAGISIIYQEPTLFPDLTVAENIFMGRQPLRVGRRIDRPAMNRSAGEFFSRGPPPPPPPKPGDCPSPTSRSSRSPRPCPPTRTFSSWTSPPRP